MILFGILAAVVGYLLGSANSSLIVGKVYGIDIRQHGSGNAGTTNALRVLGKKAALFVLIGDMLKGVLAFLAGYLLTHNVIVGMVGGMGAIIGHNWPIYFGFKGGKGVLTSFAVLLMTDWKIALILLGIFAIIVALTRYISLGSLVSSALIPVMAIILGRDTLFVVFSMFMGLLIIVLHRGNIKRLISGTESKLGEKKKEADNE